MANSADKIELNHNLLNISGVNYNNSRLCGITLRLSPTIFYQVTEEFVSNRLSWNIVKKL
jgi:hypothetical protein